MTSTDPSRVHPWKVEAATKMGLLKILASQGGPNASWTMKYCLLSIQAWVKFMGLEPKGPRVVYIYIHEYQRYRTNTHIYIQL